MHPIDFFHTQSFTQTVKLCQAIALCKMNDDWDHLTLFFNNINNIIIITEIDFSPTPYEIIIYNAIKTRLPTKIYLKWEYYKCIQMKVNEGSFPQRTFLPEAAPTFFFSVPRTFFILFFRSLRCLRPVLPLGPRPCRARRYFGSIFLA